MRLLDAICNQLPFSQDEMRVLIATAQNRYKVYPIPKRRPGEYRTIAQPTPEIKLIQRWLIDNTLSKIPVHDVATAYRKGRSIFDHAYPHAKNRFLLKMDFKDFFPSISANDVRRHMSLVGKLSEEDALVVTQLVCWRDKSTARLCLSIGAPTSPLISNSMMYEFDCEVSRICCQKGVTYSRYADDLAFSTNESNVLAEVAMHVEGVCMDLEYPRLTINHEKTLSVSKAFRRVLVGLVLTPDGRVSLGRERKRKIRSTLYRMSKDTLPITQWENLRGELSFAWSVEPLFIESLVRQFGPQPFVKLNLPFALHADK